MIAYALIKIYLLAIFLFVKVKISFNLICCSIFIYPFCYLFIASYKLLTVVWLTDLSVPSCNIISKCIHYDIFILQLCWEPQRNLKGRQGMWTFFSQMKMYYMYHIFCKISIGNIFKTGCQFKYLGALVTVRNEHAEEIKGRVSAGNKCYFFIT